MDGISHGNAATAASSRGWFVGHFVSNDPYRQTTLVEAKWGIHSRSDKKKPYEANRSACSMSILVEGKFRFEFRRGEQTENVTLAKPGDYAIWLPNVGHRGFAEEDNTVVLTLRWPSVPNDSYKVGKYAVWLIPSVEHHSFFKGLIADLASRHESHPFAPHMTLCSGEFEEDTPTLLKQVNRLIDDLQPVTLSVEGVGHCNDFFTFLFVQLSNDEAEIPFKLATDIIHNTRKPDVGAHLSLMYSNQYTQIDRTRVIEELLPTLPTKIVFDEVQIVVPKEGDWYDIPNWQVQYARKLPK
jgi:hypothetical protein